MKPQKQYIPLLFAAILALIFGLWAALMRPATILQSKNLTQGRSFIMNLNRSIITFVCLLLLSACGSAGNSTPIEVTDAWVRTVDSGMSNMGGSATALFMNLQNNSSTPDTLLMVKSDVAEMVQIHLSEVDVNGVASMHEVPGVDLPAQGIVELKPGGYHVMLMGLKQDVKEGDLIKFTLVFQNAGEMTIEAVVRTP